MVIPPKHPQRKILPFRVLVPITILAALALSFFFLHRFHKAKQLVAAPPYATQPTAKTQSEENQAMPAKEPNSTATTTPAETLIPSKPSPGVEEALEPVEIPSVPKKTRPRKRPNPTNRLQKRLILSLRTRMPSINRPTRGPRLANWSRTSLRRKIWNRDCP